MRINSTEIGGALISLQPAADRSRGAAARQTEARRVRFQAVCIALRGRCSCPISLWLTTTVNCGESHRPDTTGPYQLGSAAGFPVINPD